LAYTYVASNKDGDKKYWICEKGVR